MSINPNDKKLIREFLTYVEKEGSQSGLVLVSKGNFKSNSMYHNEVPKAGDKTLVNIRFTMERPSIEEVDDQIDLFLIKNS